MVRREDPGATIERASDEETAHDDSVLPTIERARIVPGARIDRYHVMGTLGAGGMGEVYRAYDPDLDRNVAIKVLRNDGVGGHLGLLREAQALARLSHPNVVAVYDVGTLDEPGLAIDPAAPRRVFVAMELIDGVDLATWLARKRTVDEIVAVFEAAARGLVAAHAVGIVHRDFKPANVLLGRDGRVRVADFGLARMVASPPDSDGTGSVGVLLQTQLTGTGLVVGTPSYLAPEVHMGGTADVLADQYSYFVALYEALFGKRPFVANDLEHLVRIKRAGLERLPEDVPVPQWLRRLVLRGLSREPSARHPSMAEVARQLEIGRRPPRRALGLALGVAAVVGVALWSARGDAPVEDRCAHVDRLVDEVWSEPRREAIRNNAAALAIGDPDALPVAAGLDEYIASWREAYLVHCRANPDVGVVAWQQLDPTARCLRHRLFIADGVTRPLAEPGATAEDFAGATRAVGRLGATVDCGGDAYDVEWVEPPTALLAPVEDARVELDRVGALIAIGRPKEAAAVLDDLDDTLADLDFEPLKLEVALWRGNLAESAGEYELAEQILTDTMYRAQAVRSDQLAWRAMYTLLAVLGPRLGRPDDAKALLRQAGVMVERLANPKHRVGYFEARSFVAHADGRMADAEVDLRTARLLAVATYGADDLRVAELDLNLANTMMRLGRTDETVAMLERSIVVLERHLGSDAHEVQAARGLIGGAQFLRGDLDAAERTYTQLLADRERIYGPEHPRLLTTVRQLGQIALARGEVERAQSLLDRALALGRVREPSTGSMTRGTQFVLGRLALRRGDMLGARRQFAQVVEELGEQHDDQAMMSVRALATLERACGRLERATELIDLTHELSSTVAVRLELEVDRAAIDDARGDHESARRRLDAAVATKEPIVSSDMRDTMRELRLAQAHRALAAGECADARTHFDAASPLADPNLGATVPIAVTMAWDDASIFACSGDDVRRQRAEAVATSLLGERLPKSVSPRIGLALVVADELWTLGEVVRARGVATAAQRDAPAEMDRAALDAWLQSHALVCD